MKKIKINHKRKTNFLTFHTQTFQKGSSNLYGVSEVIGVVLILAIVIGAMTGVYLMVFNPLSSDNARSPAVELLATITQDGSKIIIEHRGGPMLSDTVQITISYAEIRFEKTLRDIQQGGWRFGEKREITKDNNNLDLALSGLRVELLIYDPQSNSVIFNSMIQDGLLFPYPTVSYNKTSYPFYNEAYLLVDYNNRSYEGSFYVFFRYREIRDPTPQWSKTVQMDVDGQGTKSFHIQALVPNTRYECQAVANYSLAGGLDAFPRQFSLSSVEEFETQGSVIGFWPFNNQPTLDELFDMSGYDNHGIITSAIYQEGLPAPVGTEKIPGSPEALFFDGVDDKVVVSSSQSLKNLPDESLTLEAWVQPVVDPTYSEANIGDRSGSVTYPYTSWPFQRQFRVDHSDFIHISDEYYALVSTASNNSLYVMTKQITADGEVLPKNDVIDIWFCRIADTYAPRIFKVYDDADFSVFAIIYSTTSGPNRGYLRTIRIDHDGTINKNWLANEFNLESTNIPFRGVDMLNISSTGTTPNDKSTFAIVYGSKQGNQQGSFIRTVNISHDGSTIADVTGQKKFLKENNDKNDNIPDAHSFIHIKYETYAIVYTGSNTEHTIKPWGRICLVTIKNNGILETNDNDNFMFNDGGLNPQAIVYRYEGNFAYIAIVCQTNQGETESDQRIMILSGIQINYEEKKLSTSNIQTLDLYSGNPGSTYRLYPQFIRLKDDGGVFTNNYAVVYNPTGDSGRITTLSINPTNNSVEIKHLNNLFSYNGRQPKVITLPSTSYSGHNMLAIASTGPGTYAVLKTIPITNDGYLSHFFNDNDYLIAANDTHVVGRYPWYSPNIVHVDGEIYAITHYDIDRILYVRTVKITTSGAITRLSTHDLKIYNYTFAPPKIFTISNTGTTYTLGIAHQGRSDHAYISTITITLNAEKNNVQSIEKIKTQRIYSSTIGFIDVIHANSLDDKQMYLCVFRQETGTTYVSSGTGHIGVLNISNTGNSITFNHQQIEVYIRGRISITQMTDSLFVIGYSQGNTYSPIGKLKTYTVSQEGILQNVDTWVFHSSSCWHWWCSGAHSIHVYSINEKFVAITYLNFIWSQDMHLTIKTTKINQDGLFEKSIVDEFNIKDYTDNNNRDITSGKIHHLKDNLYLIARLERSSASNGVGFINVIRISPFTGHISDSLMPEPTISDYQYIPYPSTTGRKLNYDFDFISVNNDNSRFAFVFHYNDHFAAVISREILYSANPKTQLVAKEGSYGLWINETTIWGTINDFYVEAPFNNNTHPGWNYIVLTYNKTKANDNIELYINGTRVNQAPYNENISPTNNDVFFANLFPVIVDEVKIDVTIKTSDEILQQWNRYVDSLT